MAVFFTWLGAGLRVESVLPGRTRRKRCSEQREVSLVFFLNKEKEPLITISVADHFSFIQRRVYRYISQILILKKKVLPFFTSNNKKLNVGLETRSVGTGTGISYRIFSP